MVARHSSPLAFADARRVVLETVRALPLEWAKEAVSLSQAHGRILAEDVRADRDYPALERSLRDGFAVRAADVPGVLKVRGEVRAGDAGQNPLNAGEAIEIMTGAPVPEGADAVVMVEHAVRLDDGRIQVGQTAEAGQFLNQRAAEAAAGAVLIPAGVKLDASHIATLAMTGHAPVSVFRKPRVAILATGDEIVALDEKPAPHQIRNSNSHMLASLVNAAGGEATILPVAGDTVELLKPLLEQGLAQDMLIVSGGVSAGKYDLVKPTLRSLGVEFHFERVRVQPGQPTAFGTCNGKPVFGLPGNPGSTLITYQLFARAALELLAGTKEPFLPLLTAKFSAPFKHKLGLTRFLPARLAADGESLVHIPWQGSSDVPALARANVFLIADDDRERWAAGDSIRVMLKP
jgi:molybdopterin molybdotransferase